MLLKMMLNNPVLKKNSLGTINVTAVGMFGTGLGNLVNITPHAVSLAVGGIDWVPFNVGDKVVNREMAGLCLAAFVFLDKNNSAVLGFVL